MLRVPCEAASEGMCKEARVGLSEVLELPRVGRTDRSPLPCPEWRLQQADPCTVHGTPEPRGEQCAQSP